MHQEMERDVERAEGKAGALERRVQQLLEEQVSADRQEGEDYRRGSKRSRQVEQLQKQAERIARFLQENTTKLGTQHKKSRAI